VSRNKITVALTGKLFVLYNIPQNPPKEKLFPCETRLFNGKKPLDRVYFRFTAKRHDILSRLPYFVHAI
jgi:hypothetical protein